MKRLIPTILLIFCNVLFAEVSCGDLISKNTTLYRDLWCKTGSFGIKIINSNVEFDLNGHTIYGNLNPDYFEGVIVDNYDHVIIKNGSINGSDVAIVVGSSNDVIIEDVNIRHLYKPETRIDDKGNPYTPYITGINIGELAGSPSKGIFIRNCNFEFIPLPHLDAIMISNSFVEIENIQVHGSSNGVNFGGEVPNYGNGIVTNSKFSNVASAGVLVRCSSDVLIKNNRFYRNEIGICSDPNSSGYVKNLVVEENFINKCNEGIKFYGTMDSEIKKNIIEYKNAGRGIMLIQQCDDTGSNCFPSTNNVVKRNKVKAGDMDLQHDTYSLGNTWKRNKYKQSMGSEIK